MLDSSDNSDWNTVEVWQKASRFLFGMGQTEQNEHCRSSGLSVCCSDWQEHFPLWFALAMWAHNSHRMTSFPAVSEYTLSSEVCVNLWIQTFSPVSYPTADPHLCPTVAETCTVICAIQAHGEEGSWKLEVWRDPRWSDKHGLAVFTWSKNYHLLLLAIMDQVLWPAILCRSVSWSCVGKFWQC